MIVGAQGARSLAAGASIRGAVVRIAGDRAVDATVAASSGRLPMSMATPALPAVTARRTWRIARDLWTAADHLLPTGQFQEAPAPCWRIRTTPPPIANHMGMYLLSTGPTRDFGWTGTIDAASRARGDARDERRASRAGHSFNGR